MRDLVKNALVHWLYVQQGLRLRQPKRSSGLLGIRRVVFVELLGIGDAVCTLPAVTNLKAALPDCEVGFLCTQASAEVLRFSDRIDRLLVCGRHKNRMSLLDTAFIPWLDATDLCIVPSWSVKNSLCSLLVRGRLCAGYLRDPSYRGLYYNDYVVEAAGLHLNGSTVYRWNEHVVDRANRVLEALGIPTPEKVPFLPPVPLPRPCPERYALLCVGAVWEGRRWPPNRWAELAGRIQADLHLKPVLVWGPGEEEYARAMARENPSVSCGAGPGNAVQWHTSPRLTELLRLIQHADVVVAHDSGPMHISSALRRPTVGLFGPNLPEICGPRHDRAQTVCARFGCSPCLQNHCLRPQGQHCMDAITVDEVLDAVRRIT